MTAIRAPLSPRRRRLRWTLALLTLGAVIGVALGMTAYLRKRPHPYRPDEQLADITSSLSLNLPPNAPKPRFTEVTRAAGLAGFRNFNGPRTSQMPEDIGPGVAWGDFDNDGDDDLFLVSVGGPMHQRDQWTACELHENLGDGTFRKVAAFPELRLHGNGAAWGDCDGDGFLDLAVAGYNALLLFHNESGSGRFVRDERFPNPPGFWSSVSWGDFNNDRHLDLYACNYIQYVENEADIARGELQEGSFVPFTLNPASYPGGTNCLFRNNGDGTFTDVAAQLGVQNPEGRSLGALWHDLDDDGWLDLYVANDVSDNVFYYNRGGTFEDLSHPALMADYRSAMGLAVGDYNRDGDDDLFITHWVAQENALLENLLVDFKAKTAGATTGNGEVKQARAPSSPSLPSPTNAPARSPLRFMDLADMRGLGQMSLPYVGWGTEFVDLDGDGWLDLVVANGSTLEAAGPIPRKLKAQEAFLFWNQRGQAFHHLAPLNSSFSEPHVSRGLALSDFDNDGDMDVLIADLGEGVRLLRNDMQTGNWLKLRLRSRLASGQPLGFGDGAKVIAHVGAADLRRAVSSVSFASQSSRTLHFGLGMATRADLVEVRWHGGAESLFTNLAANTTWQITEGQGTPKAQGPTPSASSPSSLLDPPPQGGTTAMDSRARTREFWKLQRAAMDAMKVEKDSPKAVRLFREALVLDPRHQDSLYYLAHCLAASGDMSNALAQLETLQQVNSNSHRAFAQWGTLRALTAHDDADLAAAQRSLEQAHAINPEETGALLLLGEVALLRGDSAAAEEKLAAACRSNHKAVGGFFLRGYLAWKHGDHTQAVRLLEETRAALGGEWQPKGATAEGDVQRRQHEEKSPLARYWERWDGRADPASSYAALDARLRAGS
jgi:tetratricopeptide (TPR) repeat protein